MERYLPNMPALVMSRQEVRDFDAWAINAVGIPAVVLMENAGRSCAQLIMDKLAGIAEARVCIFCGIGNNGGDGFVIARHLANAGLVVRVVICGRRDKINGDARINLEIVGKMPIAVEDLDMTGRGIDAKVKTFCHGCDLIVDGIFGTGLAGEVRQEYVQLIESINAQGRVIFAIDIPSGLDCDTGRPLGTAIKAGTTVTFVAVKKGFTMRGSVQYTGEIYVASIGIEPYIRAKFTQRG